MSTLKQTKTMTGSTNSSLWTWKHIVYEYFDDDYITTNKSKIVVESYLGRPSGQSTQSFGGTASINITCNGDSRTTSRTWNYGANHIAGGGWFCIQSETFYVEHSADGTKSISVSSSLSTSDFNPHSASASGNITLTTIPRATACPNIDGYIEGSASISLLPASTSFKHRIYYSYNGKTGYYPSSSSFFSNTGSLPLDTSFYPYSPKSSNTGSITLYTYDSSGNLIGSKTGEITIRCDKEKCKPVISISVVDSNPTTTALTGNSSKLVKGYSNAKITYTITTRNSASLKSKTLNGGSLGNSPYTITNISINSFSILAIDSRDFDTTETKTSTMVDYVPLTLDFEAYRPTPTGSEIKISFQGNYFDSSFGAVSNSLSLSWKYRKKGASDWEGGGTFELNKDYKVGSNRYYSISDISLGTNFDYQTNYEVCVFYKDELIDTSITKTVPKGQPILSWEEELVSINTNLDVLKKMCVGNIKSKNLFNINAPLHKTYYSSPSISSDSLTLTTSGTTDNWLAYLINVEAYTDYTLSVESKTGGIGIYDSNVSGYIDGFSVSEGTSYTFNTSSHSQLTLVFYGNATYKKTQLEKGNVVTDYEPFRKFDCNDLVRLKEVQLTFNTSGYSVGDFIYSISSSDVPNIDGMKPIGVIPEMMSYADKNFFTSLNFRNGKVAGQMRLGYRANSSESLTGWAYIIYVNRNYFDNGTLT